MKQRSTFLVFGATGGTGRHFVARALADGHCVRALVRTPGKLDIENDRLDIQLGSITEPIDIDALVQGVDFIVLMLGDKRAQLHRRINTAFMEKLVPAMRRQGVTRLLYQAGGGGPPRARPPSPVLWMIRHTIARGFIGQHKDNEAVMAYLATEASDIEWIVHRAAIGSDGASKGTLQRSDRKLSVATFQDCAAYNYHLVTDVSAVHTSSLSAYT